MSLIEEAPGSKVRMAHLAIVGSHSTNGVAAIHSELLRDDSCRDFAEMFPERFNNKTNGVTPRRWLLLANPALAGLITEAIGDGWVTDLDAAARARCRSPTTPAFAPSSARSSAGQAAVRRLARRTHGQSSIPTSIFDCQVKRIHEYKRQLLNVLHIVVLYNRLRENPPCDFAAAHLPLRRQGGAGLSAREADHQADQQRRRDHRRRSARARAAEGACSCRTTTSRWPNG